MTTPKNALKIKAEDDLEDIDIDRLDRESSTPFFSVEESLSESESKVGSVSKDRDSNGNHGGENNDQSEVNSSTDGNNSKGKSDKIPKSLVDLALEAEEWREAEAEQREVVNDLLLEKANYEVTGNDLDLEDILKVNLDRPPWKQRTTPRVEERVYSAKYARLYSKELHEFAIGEADGVNNVSLPYSQVNTKGSVHTGILFPRYDDNHQCTNDYRREELASELLESGKVGGSFWSVDEKERFFIFLGRRSRHNMLGVAQGVRTKSVIECEEYYQLLFRCTQEYIHDNPTDRLAHGITMKDIPAAREMSEEWIDMEERQAQSMQNYERYVSLRWSHRRIIREYKSEPQFMNPKAAPIFNRNSSTKILRLNEVDSESSFINISRLFQINNRVFRKALYDRQLFSTDYYHNYIQTFESEFVEDLENTVVEMVRSVVRKLLTNYSGQGEFISRTDVIAALLSLGYPVNKEKYWHDLPRRTNLIFKDPIEVSDQESYYNFVEKTLSVEDPASNLVYDQDSIYSVETNKVSLFNHKKCLDTDREIKKRANEDRKKAVLLKEMIADEWNSKIDSDLLAVSAAKFDNDTDGSGSVSSPSSENESDNDLVDSTLDSEEGSEWSSSDAVSSSNNDSSGSDSEDGFNMSWQVRQAELSFQEDQPATVDMEMMHIQEEKELEEFDMRNSKDDEYIALVWLNSGLRVLASTDRDEILMRIAERQALKGSQYRNNLRLLRADYFSENLNYNVKKRVLQEMEEDLNVVTEEEQSRLKRLQTQRFKLLEGFKLNPKYKKTYRRFLRIFPDLGNQGIIMRKEYDKFPALFHNY